MIRQNISLVILIFIFAFLMRLIFVLSMPEEMRILRSDDYRYDQIAMSMLNGQGFAKDGEPIAWRGPGYPFFLAGIYSVFGHDTDAVRLIQSILFAFMCVFIYLIGKIAFNESVGLGASIISAAYAPFIMYLYWSGPVFVWSENLFAVMVTMTMYIILRYKNKRTPSGLILIGVSSALTALTKPSFLAFMPFLFLWFLFLNKAFWKSVKQYAVVVAFFLLCIAPWTIRNYIVFHELIPISNESGDIFYEGNHPLARGGNVWLGAEMDKDPELLKKYSPTEIKNIKYRMGLKFLLDDPGRIPGLFAKKLLVTWNFFSENNKFNLSYGLILSFAAIGMVFLARRKEYHEGGLLLILAFLWVSLITVIFFGLPRYRFPVESLLIVFASLGVMGLVNLKNKFIGISVCIALITANLLLNSYSREVLNLIKKVI